MEKTLAYSRNVGFGLAGLLVVFIGAMLIAVVLDAVTWEQLQDWTIKAFLIALIVFAVNVVGSLIVTSLTKSDKK